MLTGSVVSRENRPLLRSARIMLEYLKNAKLLIRAGKDREHSWETAEIMERLKAEITHYGLAPSFLEKCLRLANISNMTDALFMLELDKNSSVFDGDVTLTISGKGDKGIGQTKQNS